MKKINYFVVQIFLIGYCNHAQVGIGTTSPHNSSILELKTTNQGVLLPHLTTDNQNNIINPANSLLIYNNEVQQFRFYQASIANWYNMGFKTSIMTGEYTGDSSEDINRPSYRKIPIMGMTLIADDAFTVDATDNTITINHDGRYRITTNISFVTGRLLLLAQYAVIAPEIRIFVNNRPQGAYASSGVTPADFILNNSSLELTEVLVLKANDEISIRSRRTTNNTNGGFFGNIGNLLDLTGASSIFIEKIR